MKTERFNNLVKEIREASLDTLTKKNANYATAEDRLHNFKVGAAITGGTPAQAALGYMAKHLASLQDKVARNDFHDREDLKEKIQDSINADIPYASDPNIVDVREICPACAKRIHQTVQELKQEVAYG